MDDGLGDETEFDALSPGPYAEVDVVTYGEALVESSYLLEGGTAYP
jgi:hypothetical protein